MPSQHRTYIGLKNWTLKDAGGATPQIRTSTTYFSSVGDGKNREESSIKI
jgi:hypothetical protein